MKKWNDLISPRKKPSDQSAFNFSVNESDNINIGRVKTSPDKKSNAIKATHFLS